MVMEVQLVFAMQYTQRYDIPSSDLKVLHINLSAIYTMLYMNT